MRIATTLNLMATFASILPSKEEMKEKNAQKKQECIDRYWAATNLPRKQKKKVRKEAQKEYDLHCSLDRYADQYGF